MRAGGFVYLCSNRPPASAVTKGSSMPADPRMKELEDYWKASSWKKIANIFYVSINDETMAHFLPLRRGNVLLVRAGVTNRRLNRVCWDITGLPAEFGTPKQQLMSANMCMLGVANAELEIREAELGPKTGQSIITFTLDNARQFDSIAKIRKKILDAPEPARQHFLGDLVCVELALGDRASATKVIETAKAADPLYETTFIGRAERFLALEAPGSCGR